MKKENAQYVAWVSKHELARDRGLLRILRNMHYF